LVRTNLSDVTDDVNDDRIFDCFERGVAFQSVIVVFVGFNMFFRFCVNARPIIHVSELGNLSKVSEQKREEGEKCEHA
jgi:hypothetical protein